MKISPEKYIALHNDPSNADVSEILRKTLTLNKGSTISEHRLTNAYELRHVSINVIPTKECRTPSRVIAINIENNAPIASNDKTTLIASNLKRRSLKGLKIKAVTIKFRLDNKLVKIGQYGTNDRNYPDGSSLQRGYENHELSPFLAILSHAVFYYSKVSNDQENNFRHNRESPRFLALNNIRALPLHTPNLIHRIMEQFDANAAPKKYEGTQGGVCEELYKRSNNNYSACMGIPIQPHRDGPITVDDYKNGVVGFIGIDSDENYAWDMLTIDLVNFLAATADLLHNIMVYNLLYVFRD